jgi:hypothetical protein
VGRRPLNRLAGEEDLAFPWRQYAVDGAKGRGLAGSVGADEGDDFTFFDGQGDAAQGLDVPVVADRLLGDVEVDRVDHQTAEDLGDAAGLQDVGRHVVDLTYIRRLPTWPCSSSATITRV